MRDLHIKMFFFLSDKLIIFTGRSVKVDVPQYLRAAKSYALAADTSSSHHHKLLLHLQKFSKVNSLYFSLETTKIDLNQKAKRSPI